MKIVFEKTSSNINWILSILQYVLPFLGVIIGTWMGSLASKRTIKASRKDKEISEIKETLNKLYYPLVLLIRKNAIFYDLFKPKNDQSFRTLTALLKGDSFNDNNAILLEKY